MSNIPIQLTVVDIAGDPEPNMPVKVVNPVTGADISEKQTGADGSVSLDIVPLGRNAADTGPLYPNIQIGGANNAIKHIIHLNTDMTAFQSVDTGKVTIRHGTFATTLTCGDITEDITAVVEQVDGTGDDTHDTPKHVEMSWC